MGRLVSYRADAAMEKVKTAAKASRPSGEDSYNVYFVGNKKYFFEESNRQLDDDGIGGTINLCLPDSDGKQWAREVGRFRIDGNGRLLKGPKFFRKAIEG